MATDDLFPIGDRSIAVTTDDLRFNGVVVDGRLSSGSPIELRRDGIVVVGRCLSLSGEALLILVELGGGRDGMLLRPEDCAEHTKHALGGPPSRRTAPPADIRAAVSRLDPTNRAVS